jgi:hypothetical protein
MLKRKKVVGLKTLVEPMNIRSYYCANGKRFVSTYLEFNMWWRFANTYTMWLVN